MGKPGYRYYPYATARQEAIRQVKQEIKAKEDKRFNSKEYREGWDRIFGKKEKESKS